MGGPNLEIFKVRLSVRRCFLAGADLAVVWPLHHVSHRVDVLLRHKPRESLLGSGFLAQT